MRMDTKAKRPRRDFLRAGAVAALGGAGAMLAACGGRAPAAPEGPRLAAVDAVRDVPQLETMRELQLTAAAAYAVSAPLLDGDERDLARAFGGHARAQEVSV